MGQGEWGQAIAHRIYARTRASYHNVTAASLDRILHVNGAEAPAHAGGS